MAHPNPQLIVSFKYRVLVEGKWCILNNGMELDYLLKDLLRRGAREEEIEIEIVEVK